MPDSPVPGEPLVPDRPPPAFRDVDADDTTHLVAMMDATDEWPAVQAARAWVLEQAGLRLGSVSVDVGCGPGTFNAAVREAGAYTIDVDRSTAMLGALRSRHTGASVAMADIGRLPLVDGGADLVHAERILQWTADPDAALAELCRITAPAGCLAVTDTDWGSFTVVHPDTAAATRLPAAALRWVAHPTLAPTLPDRLAALGATRMEVRSDTVTIDAWNPDDPAHGDGPPGLPLQAIAAAAEADERPATSADVDALARLARQGRFSATLTLVTVTCRPTT